MDEKKFTELSQQAVDRTLSIQQRNQLDKLMEHHPHLKHQYTKMKQVSEVLSRVGAIDPPEHLKNNILKQIDRAKYQSKPVEQDGFRIWLEWFFKPKPKVAFAFCTGIIFGGILIMLFLSGWFNKYPISNVNLTGTIGLNDRPVIEKLYDFSLIWGDPGSSIKVNCFDRLVWLDMNFSDENDLQIILDYDPGILQFDPALLLQLKEMSVQTLENQVIAAGKQGGHLVAFFVKNEPPTTVVEVTVWCGQVKKFSEKN